MIFKQNRKKRIIHPIIKGALSLAAIFAILYLGSFAFRFCLGLFMEGDYIVRFPGQDSPIVSQSGSAAAQTNPSEPGQVTEIARANLLAAGDLMTHLPIVRSGENGGEYNFEYIFRYIAPYVSKADYAMVNLETTLSGTDNGKEYTGYPKFNAPDAIAAGVRSGGFDMMLTSSNHCYDYGTEGLLRTLDVVKGAGLDTLGTTQLPEDIKYTLKDINGIKVGIISYTFAQLDKTTGLPIINELPADSSASGLINFFDTDNLDAFYAEMARHITAMKTTGAEALVLYIHWGNENSGSVTDQQKTIAQKMCELGVDVVVGTHPHIVQDIALLTSADGSHKTLCMYSLGTFLSNLRADNNAVSTGQTEDSVLLNFSFVKYSNDQVYLDSVSLQPTWVLIRGSGDDRTYHILPLDPSVNDWVAAYDLTADQAENARKSSARTMDPLSDKLSGIQSTLSQQKADRENDFGMLSGGVG